MLNNEEIEALLGIQTMTCKKLADQAKLAIKYKEALKDLYENRFEPDKLHILIPKYHKELGDK